MSHIQGEETHVGSKPQMVSKKPLTEMIESPWPLIAELRANKILE